MNRFNEGRDMRLSLSLSQDELMKQIDIETKKDMVYNFILGYHDHTDKLPTFDEITEYYEDIYLDDTLIQEVFESW